jgi:hypothetical protein
VCGFTSDLFPNNQPFKDAKLSAFVPPFAFFSLPTPWFTTLHEYTNTRQHAYTPFTMPEVSDLAIGIDLG